MKTYALYVADDRYSVPTLVLLPAASEGRARAKATELLLESSNHLSVKVSYQGVTLFTGGGRRASPGSDGQGYSPGG